MDFRFLYLDTRGSIGRKAWWLGAAGLIVIWMIVAFVIGIAGFMLGLQRTALGLGVMQLVTTVILFRPVYALSLKRLHDRARPERLFWMFFAPSFIVIVLAMLGLSGTMVEAEMFGQTVQAFKANALGHVASLAAFLAFLWAAYELGFRKSASVGEHMRGSRGIVHSGIPDLSSNPAHLEGFGRDSAPNAVRSDQSDRSVP